MPFLRLCVSWRFVNVPGHDRHDRPGGCKECWVPCVEKLTLDEWRAGKRRCDTCADSLIHASIPTVRRALVTDKYVTVEVLRALTSDPSGPVSAAAERRLFELEREQNPNKVHWDSPEVDIAPAVAASPRRAYLAEQQAQSHDTQVMQRVADTSIWSDRA